MTEKRFQEMRVVDNIGRVYDSETDRVLELSDVVFLLNSLAEENAEFLQSITESAIRTSQLRKQVKEQQDKINQLENKLKEKEKELEGIAELREDFNLDKYLEMKKLLEKYEKAELERSRRFG